MFDAIQQYLLTREIPTELTEWVAENAQGIDSGRIQVRNVLSRLADFGMLDLGASANHEGQLLHQASAIEQLARRSFSTGFALWGHRMCIEFLSLAGGSYAESLLPALRSGTTPGASAMAPGYKALAEAGDLSLRVDRDGRGQYRLSGRIAWASNLYSDAIAITPAYGPDAPEHTSGAEGGVVVALPLNSPGVTIGPELELLAMRGTASTSVELDGVVISPDQILTTDFVPFLQRTRPTLSILQASFCLGLATTCYAHAVENATGANANFMPEIQEQGRMLTETKQQLAALAQAVGTATPTKPVDVLSMRLNAGRLGVELAALELKTAGGKGFVTTSDTNRRYRESTFIPLQSPSEAQLRWELEQLQS
ncbi:acyl-CoA dehydrogenase family protein [Enteractinococcus coprophilus]|uniref:Alkylation response protein AidB-like acyl-CoA dehydrogenase n=1 Tax=Enteractinococcus coprophilus TaxID=1027633 RepID=A0A543AFG7_9MICC|nr:acyl-CoA dehydrogenase family protein [Enteractinococcus coprophilus]TQL71319.1 alkylation response protein AidB-like acyl-CoA dehydrogenase [Enteractinococcus coprophilus]